MTKNKVFEVPIILASASPRRSQLLKDHGFKFSILPSRIKEQTCQQDPVEIVQELALKKAIDVAKRLEFGIVIGADTIVVLEGEIIGKPESIEDAQRILNKLNGSYHKVYSGIAVVDAKTNKKEVGYEVSNVKMREIDSSRINILAGRHLDKAGAYAVQEKNDAFVEKIEGDYFNVVGLPINKLKNMLKKFGVRVPNR